MALFFGDEDVESVSKSKFFGAAGRFFVSETTKCLSRREWHVWFFFNSLLGKVASQPKHCELA